MRDMFEGIERDRRVALQLAEARRRYERSFAWWAVSFGLSIILAGLALTLTIWECFRVHH